MNSRVLPSYYQSILGRYGPGGDSARPERLRWVRLYNNSGSSMFIPERTQNERTSVYYNFPQKDRPDPAYGYTPYRRLYNNTAVMGNGPCWNWNSNSANYRSPPGCPGGYAQEGVTNTNNVNPNNQWGRAGVHHFDGAWMFFFEKAYGCNSNSFAKVSVRRCYRSASVNGYV